MDTASAVGNRDEGRARWSLRLFGGFELTQLPGGERLTTLGKRERVALAYLALSPNSRVQRRKMATLLWGDATDATLLDNLRTCIWSLRKALGDSEHRLVASEGEDIVLQAGAFDVDAVSFRRLAAQPGLAELEEAAKLSTGPFLEGLDIDSEDFESWCREEATRFRDQTIEVLNRLMTQLADLRETERAIAAGTRLLRLEPLHEGAVRRLMRLYAASDRRGAAIEVYRKLADTLRFELNAQPKAETRAVFIEISGAGAEQTHVPAPQAVPPVLSSEPPHQPAPAASNPSSASWPATAGHPGEKGPDGVAPHPGSKWPVPGGTARRSWGMAEFFAELKRRHIYRVGAAYLVVAWTLAQFIGMLSQVFELAPWIARSAVILLAIGFPVALVATWIMEAKPQQALASAVRSQSSAADWALFGALGLVTVLIGYQLLSPSASSSSPPRVEPTVAVSIAVLPLANLSGDASQEFFSDGLTEEITATLAKLPDLRVVGRTSAFQFKGQNQDLRAIGQALSATHLLEGSVRKDGDRLRITTQLIKADDGTHVWAENYDRQLTDIFAIQEDIARAIAAALRMPLGLAPGQTLVALRPKDEQTYELFLRGRAAIRARNRGEEAVALLDQAVARDPNFAPAWRYLAAARNQENIGRSIRGEALKTYPESEETLARKVIALAPDSADGYAMLANLAQQEGQKLEAMQLQEQALERDPNDAEVMNNYANSLWELGYLKEALAIRDRQHVLEPLIPIWNFLRAETLAANGMLDQAIRDWVAARPNAVAGGIRLIAPAYAGLGRFDDAIEVIRAGGKATVAQTGGTPPPPQAQIDAAVQVLRAAAKKEAPPAPLPFEEYLSFVYAYTSTPERMLDEFDNQGGRPTNLRNVWWPVPPSLRKTERFKTLMREAGFVDIWRMRGWPDRCRPVGADDFACE